MSDIHNIIKQCLEDQEEVFDLYDETEVRRNFGIPKEYFSEMKQEFMIEIDREGLQTCNSSLYSKINSEVVDKESSGVCTDYDYWFMISDMSLFPEFKAKSTGGILKCALYYNKVYIMELFAFLCANYSRGKFTNKLPYSYRYYELRTRYLMEMSEFDFNEKVCFVPVKSKKPNACVKKSDKDLYILKIGVGLEYILDRLTRFVSYSQIETRDYIKVILPNLKIQIVQIALFYYGKITSTQMLGIFLTLSNKMEECRNRRIEQMDFIMCHEMGHIYYNNINDIPNKEAEIMSDDFAMNVLLSESDSNNIYRRGGKNSIVASVLILFMELSLVENVYYRICEIMKWEKPILTDNHPSYEERYKNIVSVVGGIEYIDYESRKIISSLQLLEIFFAKWPDELLKECVNSQLQINANEIKKMMKEKVKDVL